MSKAKTLAQTVSTGGALSTGNIQFDTVVPSQSGNNGKFLTTNGTATSWGSVPNPTFDSLAPTQTSNSGKFLTTNGTSASWATVDALPSQTGNNGKYLTTDGTTASWASVGGAITTPTLSASATTAVGGSTVTVTITNYNNTYSYNIAVQAGSYTFNTTTGVITWVLPNVSSNTNYNCFVQAAYSGQVSSTAQQTETVTTSLVTDTAIVITNFAVYSSNNGWAI